MNESLLKQRLEVFKDITYRYNLIFPNSYLFIGQKEKWSLSRMMRFWLYYLHQNPNPSINLYFHFPFCYQQRCSYCLYKSSVLQTEKQLDDYLQYMKNMMIFYYRYFSKVKFKTLYIGGGTPSLMTEKQLEYFLDNIKRYFTFNEKNEQTIEMSPLTATKEKISICKKYGINRISMGIQTFNPEILRNINRIGTTALNEIKNLVAYILDQGFEDFSIDLIAGLPGESIDSILDNIKKAISLNVPSIILYKYLPPQNEYEKYDSKYYQDLHNSFYPQLYKELTGLIANSNYIEKTQKSTMMPLYIFTQKQNRTKKEYYLGWDAKKNNSILGIGKGASNMIQNKYFSEECFDLERENAWDNPSFDGYYLRKDDQIRNYTIISFWYVHELNSSDFYDLFNIDFFEYFKEEVEFLKKQKVIAVDNRIIRFNTENVLELSFYLKYFYRYEYLLKHFIDRKKWPI